MTSLSGIDTCFRYQCTRTIFRDYIPECCFLVFSAVADCALCKKRSCCLQCSFQVNGKCEKPVICIANRSARESSSLCCFAFFTAKCNRWIHPICARLSKLELEVPSPGARCRTVQLYCWEHLEKAARGTVRSKPPLIQHHKVLLYRSGTWLCFSNGESNDTSQGLFLLQFVKPDKKDAKPAKPKTPKKAAAGGLILNGKREPRKRLSKPANPAELDYFGVGLPDREPKCIVSCAVF
jgi:hypothetical protein